MKQQTGRKMLGILLTLALVLGLVPGMTMTALAEEKYNLWVGNTQVTETNASDVFNDGTVSYAVGTNTLTLNGVNISTGYKYNTTWGYSAGIYYKNGDTPNNPLNIELKGTNSISGNDITSGIYGGNYYGSFTFLGDGYLDTTGATQGIGTDYGSMEIISGTINASGTGDSSIGIGLRGGITIKGGTVKATGANYGISTLNGVSITGGTVTAQATNSTSDTGSAIYNGNNGISITGGNSYGDWYKQ